MSKNHIGTIFRIVIIFSCLFSFWSILVGFFYFIISILFDIPFSFLGYVLVFIGFIFSRMIYFFCK